MISESEKAKNAREFAAFWKDRGDEKQDTQMFWVMLLRNILDVYAPERTIDFEKKVSIENTKYIDAYLADTKIAIEQKSSCVNLDKKEVQSDGAELTPFEQAKRYNDNLVYSEKCRWIIVCNFKEFRIYDMNCETPESNFSILRLSDFEKEYYRLQFLIDEKNEAIRREEEISIQAGKIVRKLYEALLPLYRKRDAKELRSINILCVRLVFCFYAEKSGLFATHTTIEDYIKSYTRATLVLALLNLFKALDTPISERNEYDETVKDFPYVDGGLFKDEDIIVPSFNQKVVDILLNDFSSIDWSEISPTIFGALFESTLNPETRKTSGMHYTAIENIHKVIDPLFFSELEAEFNEIVENNSVVNRDKQLFAFQKKLGALKFLDPACGSGNFLTETYLSLRRLENECIKLRLGKQKSALDVLGADFEVQVKIENFYGIEINDFAVTVAKTAMWIAECQMMKETSRILDKELTFFPLTTAANIVENNALRLDWQTLEPIDESAVVDGLFEGFMTELDGSKIAYNYIMGNPPFIGASTMSQTQKKDAVTLFGKGHLVNSIDYVGAWYYKAAELIKDTNIKCAFVSTNSITQGEQVFPLWNVLLEKGIHLDFAYRTFKWENENNDRKLMAHVHCVVIGFSSGENGNAKKAIYNEDGSVEYAQNISPYLLDMPNILVECHSKPFFDVPAMTKGNQPTDDGNLIFSEDEYKAFVAAYPNLAYLLHRYIGAKDFLNNNKVRYCLWLKDVSPTVFARNKEIMRRLDAVKAFREKSSAEPTRKYALTPWKFFSSPQQNTNYILIPRVSSERRKYIPISIMPSDYIAADSCSIILDDSLYLFGVLTSSVHMAWMRVIGGRLEMSYRYSGAIVYNTFPWCTANEKQKAKIEKTAQNILDVRAKYSMMTLAELYGEHMYLYTDLVKAHEENDRAVKEAYGFDSKMSEEKMVVELLKMYATLL